MLRATSLPPSARKGWGMSDAVLRTIDKCDRIGIEGVVALLQKPESAFGAGLDKITAQWIGQFLGTKGQNNDETIANMRAWFARASLIQRRLDLMTSLESTDAGDGRTQWDNLIDTPPNGDQSWSNGGRPENIGWALDDIAIRAQGGGE